MIGFDHRKSVLSRIPTSEDYRGNLTVHIDVEKSSSTAVYEYFSAKLSEIKSSNVSTLGGYFLFIYSFSNTFSLLCV